LRGAERREHANKKCKDYCQSVPCGFLKDFLKTLQLAQNSTALPTFKTGESRIIAYLPKQLDSLSINKLSEKKIQKIIFKS